MSYYIVEQCGRPHASPAKPGGPCKPLYRNRYCRMSDMQSLYNMIPIRMLRLLFYIITLLCGRFIVVMCSTRNDNIYNIQFTTIEINYYINFWIFACFTLD